jgi:hypothetical protein
MTDGRFLGSTPKIRKKEVEEIMAMEVDYLGGGVVRYPNAVDPHQEKIVKWIGKNAQAAHEQRWKYDVDLDGNTYAVNEDGNKFSLEHLSEVPVRVLEPVKEDTDPEIVKIFQSYEDQIYKCLIKYIHDFPMVLGTIWWRERGHIIKYGPGDFLGVHNDNDANYRATGGRRYVPYGQSQMRQVVAVLVYINDCADSPEDYDNSKYLGGELFFPYLNIEAKPKAGDVFIFPTNYIASHGVRRVILGNRYCYLEFFSQGSNHDEYNVNIAEADECEGWCRAHWIDSLYDDYTKYCITEEFGKDEVEVWRKPNPAYDNRALEGKEGLKLPYYHEKGKELHNLRGKIDPKYLNYEE